MERTPRGNPRLASSAPPTKTCSANLFLSAFSVYGVYSDPVGVPSVLNSFRTPATLQMHATVQSITREEALRQATQAALPDLLTAATELRAQGKGTVITYSKKVFIPLTTLCRDYCSYCTFRNDPRQPCAHSLTPAEV